MTNLESESALPSKELRQASPSIFHYRKDRLEDPTADLRSRNGDMQEVHNYDEGALSTNSLQFIRNVSSRITRNAKRGARRRVFDAVNEVAGIGNFRDRLIRQRDETRKRCRSQLGSKLNELREVADELRRQTASEGYGEQTSEVAGVSLL
ncbi:hypothetical protein Pmar_PMAR003389 [Perkinsus marinus ATCC 50983]|uniref:Uncharacterized protein n=1 Tax=Perkinsus marinus (strain ATCC 50983 / TXsc) TaxID=423536 RepID=C5KH69_PERM5|nr:hypothetical protein Pmar_PMAR003389 [Perkinsus marinus ATCC 50983]EER15931.1 hypothetical protein Pmar_PMAR003389 [Perkinsus marinus ATCC 50983]|eukprot:XP_002784135.1 hypothetical protein Pmar_PMAR003389 [Perkinsus marinus ATCC 50983]